MKQVKFATPLATPITLPNVTGKKGSKVNDKRAFIRMDGDLNVEMW